MKIIFFLIFVVNIAFSFENSVGIGVAYSKSIYIENEDNKIILPMVYYETDDFYIKGIEFGYKIKPLFSLVVEPSFQNAKIASLPTQKDTILSGFKLEQRFGQYKISYKLLRDMGNIHDGVIGKIQFAKSIIAFPVIIIPSFGFEYESSKVTKYLYGVPVNTPYEMYTPKESVSANIGLMGIYNISNKYVINLMVNKKFLSDEITNSQVVNSSSKTSYFLSTLYKF